MPSPVLAQPEAEGEMASESNVTAESKGQITETQPDTDVADASQAIAEGKEKARAVVAASGTPSKEGSNAETSDDADSGTAIDKSSSGNDEPSVGRKRSRSGSRISQADTKTLPARTKESYKRLQIEQYQYREEAHHAAIASATLGPSSVKRGRRLDEDVRHKAKWFESWYSQDRLNQAYARQIQPAASVYGDGYEYWNKEFLSGPPRFPIVFQSTNPRRMIKSSRELRQSKKERVDQSLQEEELVPIRLDIEWDKIRLRDTFTWNLHDQHITVERFAKRLLNDFGLPDDQYNHLKRQVIQSMHEQIQDYHPHAIIHDPDSVVDETQPYSSFRDEELRVVIKLNITIGPNTLVDQFEWDLNSPPHAPEMFARHMAWELSLSGEFTTAIAHAIREQCQLFTKSLYVVGHTFDGRPIDDHELAANFQPSPLTGIFRPHQAAKEFTPYLYDLNEADLEKTELSVSREERAQKRSVNRRGGPTLPDLKNRPKTLRTLVVSNVLPGAAETIDESRLYKRVQVAQKKKGRHDDSEEEDSDDSLAESIQPSQGTARTRGLRAANAVAQTAMRNAAGRSVTPAQYHGSPSPEPTTLIVKLKLTKAKMQQFERAQRSRTRDHRPDSSSSPARALKGTSMPPPTGTPRSQPGELPRSNDSPAPKNSDANSKSTGGANLGRVAAAGHPSEGYPTPPAPAELLKALEELQQRHPDDAFEPVMRLTAVSDDTGEPISLKGGSALPPNAKWYYYPRIKCNDCPGKLYTPDKTLGASNFEVHLSFKQHMLRVQERLEKS